MSESSDKQWSMGRIKRINPDAPEPYGFIEEEPGKGVYFELSDIVGFSELDEPEQWARLQNKVVHFEKQEERWGQVAKQIIIADLDL